MLGVANALQVTYNGATLGSSSAPGASIPPGAYQVIVDNSIGDVGFTFHLSGPGVSLQTDVAGGEQDTETWDETFQASSTYQFEDDTNPAATLRFFSTTPPVAWARSARLPGPEPRDREPRAPRAVTSARRHGGRDEEDHAASEARDADRLGQRRRVT